MNLRDLVGMIRNAVTNRGAIVDLIKGQDLATVLARLGITDKANWSIKFVVEKFADDAAVLA
ncbi:hypothetical protein FDZ73_19040, partial [bacterium]